MMYAICNINIQINTGKMHSVSVFLINYFISPHPISEERDRNNECLFSIAIPKEPMRTAVSECYATVFNLREKKTAIKKKS